MISSIEHRYATLLLDYSLAIQPGEKLYIKTTTAAEPLMAELYREALKRGAIVEFDMKIAGQEYDWMKYASEAQLKHLDTTYAHALQHFDAYLVILAPWNLRDEQTMNLEKLKLRREVVKPVLEAYNQRTASGALKRSLCLYPTQAAAQNAGLTLDAYRQFVYKACKLDRDDPIAAWQEVRHRQQRYVDRLNQAKEIKYQGEHIDITFSVEGRTWINSDGRTNMPSGEVFSAPVEDSVQGEVYFSYPATFRGYDVEGVRLWVKDGYIERWEAKRGQVILDRVMKMKGARRFGEVAIGTNYDIQRTTRQILFDEKIGGSIHMAVGQSYQHCGGKNQSPIHWDMITDMRKDGQILADGEVIYEKGRFLMDV